MREDESPACINANMTSVDPKDVAARPRPVSNMRKSCHFCRSRKIRCSGQSICGACRDRKIDCVYGVEASKGRPKGSSVSGISKAGVSKNVAPESKVISPTELSLAAAQERRDASTVEDPASTGAKTPFTHFDELMGQSKRSGSGSNSAEKSRRKDTGVDNGGMEPTVSALAYLIPFRNRSYQQSLNLNPWLRG